MLKTVVRPDRKKVEFTYDALGRRLTKTFQDQTTHFVWDGNVPLHEWTSSTEESNFEIKGGTLSGAETTGELEHITPENLTTWVFEDGTFIPMAKLQGEKSYSIITDHLGTPTEAYDEQGDKVWSRQLNIYGETRRESGEKNFIPFLYQGQYFDEETELAYNRYRYYSPETGLYVSQDPIRLEGNNPNIYAYVEDVNSWIDPFGLECYKGNPKKKVNSGNVGDEFRTPSTHPEDFIKKGKNHTNVHTKEIWQRSNTQHSGGLEWKVGRGKGVQPRKSSKVTLTDDGVILKFD
jgi:RHS repeat-associated protein